jgi:hypothetical protein
MDGRIEKLLTGQKSFLDVNLDSQSNILLNNTTRPLPLNKINKVISQSEQADKERQESNKYRFYGTIKPVISNVLYNENIKIFIDKDSDNTTFNQRTTAVVQSPDIIEENGWFGYYDNDPFQSQQFVRSATDFNDNESSLCQFIPFDPGYNRLNFLDTEGTPNYLLKITYPAYSRDDIPLVTNGNDQVTLADGIAVVELSTISLNNRDYTGFRTSINHGLVVGDEVKLYNFSDLTNGLLGLTERTFKVFKLGNQTNDDKDTVFVIDISPLEIQLNLGKSTFKRVVNDVESSYYLRVFSAMTTDDKDYEIFPAGFATNVYEDRDIGFNFIKDIDIDSNVYRDNLGRPLSEVYLTIIKIDNDSDSTSIQDQYWDDTTNPNPFWVDRTPGFLTEKHPNINYNLRGFGDPNINNTYFNSVDETDTEFEGDIVEYNTEELYEKILIDVQHRFNTEYRENRSNYTSNPTLEDKKEGYIYKPHYRIKIRDFSSYIEDGDPANTIGIPDYATLSYSGTNGETVYKWRDFLDVGIYDQGNAGVDYPFVSGAHYIFLHSRFYLRRQDPPCDVVYSEEVRRLPGQEESLGELLSSPNFVQVLNVEVGGNTTNEDDDLVVFNGTSSTPFSIDVTVRMVDYNGNYQLGKRDVPGGCVDIELIDVKDISNEC